MMAVEKFNFVCGRNSKFITSIILIVFVSFFNVFYIYKFVFNLRITYRVILIIIMQLIVVIYFSNLSISQTLIQDRKSLSVILSQNPCDKILILNSGKYGNIRLIGKLPYSCPDGTYLTIKSIDSGNPAVIEGLDMVDVSNIIIENIFFKYNYKIGDSTNLRPFTVRNARNIKFINNIFEGDYAHSTNSAADSFGTAIGLGITSAVNVTLSGNIFKKLHRGAVFASVDQLRVEQNELTDLRSDGLNFVAVTNVVISRNYIHNFRTSMATGDHPDMIQFWTTGTNSPSVNVAIRDNILDSGAGPWTQTIFMRNEQVDNRRAGPEMFYRNLSITGNLIRNAHLHGITVGETKGLTISNNTILQAVETERPNDVKMPRINVSAASEDVRIENNIAARFPEPRPGWIIAGNSRVQRHSPRARDFYTNVFIDALAPGDVPSWKLQLLPDTSIEDKRRGSPLTLFNARPAQPIAIISSKPLTAARNPEFRLEATGAYGPDGSINLNGASAAWTLGERETKTGLQLIHRFPYSGIHKVKLVLTLPNGLRIEAERTIQSE